MRGSRSNSLGELRAALAAITACEAGGALGAIPTGRAVKTWLPTLDRPSYQPPDWVFGPVWTGLYALMGLAAHLLRRSPASKRRAQAQQLFAVQLVLNVLWSWLFFGRRSTGAGLLDALALLAAVALTTRALWRVSRPAALLFTPYLVWVAFATVLTADLHRRNRAR